MKPRIMIVEDEALVAFAMQEDLQERGYVVTGLAATAQDAIRLARETRPAVVIMDVRLRGTGDGVDAANVIERDSPGTRIVFVTGSREPETLRRIEADHPSGLLIKPVGPDEIERAILAALA